MHGGLILRISREILPQLLQVELLLSQDPVSMVPVPDMRKQRVRRRCSVLLAERIRTRRSLAMVLVPGGVNSYVPVFTATSTCCDSGVPS